MKQNQNQNPSEIKFTFLRILKQPEEHVIIYSPGCLFYYKMGKDLKKHGQDAEEKTTMHGIMSGLQVRICMRR